jgi:hypothetical protein
MIKKQEKSIRTIRDCLRSMTYDLDQLSTGNLAHHKNRMLSNARYGLKEFEELEKLLKEVEGIEPVLKSGQDVTVVNSSEK